VTDYVLNGNTVSVLNPGCGAKIPLTMTTVTFTLQVHGYHLVIMSNYETHFDQLSSIVKDM